MLDTLFSELTLALGQSFWFALAASFTWGLLSVLSTWQSESDIVVFAGENWNKAVIPHGMEKYVSECWVNHYEDFN